MRNVAIIMAMLSLCACGEKPEVKKHETITSSVEQGTALPRVSRVADTIQARRAAEMTAKLHGKTAEHTTIRGNVALSRVTGTAPRILIPGVDDQ